MAGKSDRSVRTLVICAILSASLSAPLRAETVHGESRDLGIRFETLGGTKWCGPSVKIRLSADDASKIDAESIVFIQMVGRIRAVVQSECAQVEFLTFEGRADSQVVLLAEMGRITKWRRLITRDAKTGNLNCPPAVPQGQCAKQADAYTTATRLFVGDAFADTEVVNALDAESSNLSFRSKDVVGKLRIVAKSELPGQYATGAQFADAIAADIGAGCADGGGSSERRSKPQPNSVLTQRAVLCRALDRPDSQNVIVVWNTGDAYRVFSLFAEGEATSQVSAFAGRLMQAIKKQH